MNSWPVLNSANEALHTEVTSHLRFRGFDESDEDLKMKVNIGRPSAFVFSVNI